MFIKQINKSYVLMCAMFLLSFTNTAYAQVVPNYYIANDDCSTPGDLTTAVTSTPPAGTTVTYHTSSPATDANKFAGDASAAPVGTYYAAYWDSVNNCYSPASEPFYVAKCLTNTCPATTVDLTGVATGSSNGNGVLEWHTSNTPSPATKVADITSVGAGIYWAVYYDSSSGGCYSPVSSPVVVTIEDCNSGTIANNDINDTPQDTPVSGNLLTNDEDPEGDSQTVNTTPVTQPTNGTVVINTDGTYTYTPDSGFTGEDSFVYEVCDDGNPQACDQATVTINVIPDLSTDNNPPVAGDDTATTPQDTPVTSSVLGNDSDPDGDNLTVNTTPVTQPTNGSVTLNPDGTYTYTPDTGFTGEDSFVYEVCDDGTPQECTTATVTITIPETPDENVTYANDDANTGLVNEDQTGNVLDNDTDSENNTQTVNTTPVSQPNNGTVVLNSDGTYTYTPNADFVGNDEFVYEVCDNGTPQACDQATVYLTVLDEPNTTDAVDDINQTPQDTPVSGNLLTNDDDAEGGEQKVTSVTVGGVTTAVPQDGSDVTINLTEGILTINEDGEYTFTPAAGYTGTVPDIGYEVTDANGATDTAVLSIKVLPNSAADNAPIAQNDTNTVEQGAEVTTNVLANDSHIDGESLSVTGATGLDSSGNTVALSTTPTQIYAEDPNNPGTYILAGTAILNADGTISFTADAGSTGDVQIDYTIEDQDADENNDTNGNDTDSATLLITVESANATDNDTYANDDANIGYAGVTQTGNVITSNDNDPEGNTQTVTSITYKDSTGNDLTTAVPAGGSTTQDVYVEDADNPGTYTKAGEITMNSDGTYTWNPEADYVGTVPVVYAITDNNATNPATDKATLYLTTMDEFDPCAPTPTIPDTDGDGLNDECDYDDDNDGIKDVDENVDCYLSITNGELEGTPAFGNNITGIGYATGWTFVPHTEAHSEATRSNYNTADIWGSTGPNTSAGAFGIAYEGETFAALMYGRPGTNLADRTQDGNRQVINGLTVGESYTINFMQTVAKYSVANANTGNFKVYIDGNLIGESTTSTSTLNYDDPNLIWEPMQVSFTATSTSHTLDFLAFNENFVLIDGSISEQAQYNVYMGLDAVKIEKDNCISDTDGDGIPNNLDLDSDNDGIPDNIEAQSTIGYTPPSGTDNNNDGLDHVYNGGLTPIDTDGDGTPDWLDADSDNDGITDVVEGDAADGTGDTADDDGDGVQNQFDNIDGSTERGTPSNVANTTAPTSTTTQDNYPNNDISSTVEVDFREAGCTFTPTYGTPEITYVGISTLDRNVETWLPQNLSAYIVLESSKKGFIITRNDEPENMSGSSYIASPEVGMIVWDPGNVGIGPCLSMYFDKTDDGVDNPTWNCISNSCN